MTALFAFIGMSCLCLSMTRHKRDVLGRPLSPTQSRGLRVLGWAVLLLSFGVALPDGALAILRWIGELSLAALAAVAMSALVSSRRRRAGRR
ncbi:DUF3325 domain-containing protein [Sphingobium vermicomposti]|uniref:DUF3325 domain-containing protein n=1 Tax=Sphingobium vermicomposti TaxID=529005 RepID=A0A846MBI8_9SPHN|nr:DUF3325 domain-containing protein [Sphingobium vermicomposti]NIJ17990.1 hypothetical protein [Sphingobium vermicomposti]